MSYIGTFIILVCHNWGEWAAGNYFDQSSFCPFKSILIATSDWDVCHCNGITSPVFTPHGALGALLS